MEKERRGSKEFSFSEENLLHRRRPSASGDVHSGTQSEDDEIVPFEVRRTRVQHFAQSPKQKIEFHLLIAFSRMFI